MGSALNAYCPRSSLSRCVVYQSKILKEHHQVTLSDLLILLGTQHDAQHQHKSSVALLTLLFAVHCATGGMLALYVMLKVYTHNNN